MKQTPITINDEQELDIYTVNFTGDYATVTVTVNAIDDDDVQGSRLPMVADPKAVDLVFAESCALQGGGREHGQTLRAAHLHGRLL